jgi:hypothetical protein
LIDDIRLMPRAKIGVRRTIGNTEINVCQVSPSPFTTNDVTQATVSNMKCLRVYATADGESHFDEVESRQALDGFTPMPLHSPEEQTVLWISLPHGLENVWR